MVIRMCEWPRSCPSKNLASKSVISLVFDITPHDSVQVMESNLVLISAGNFT